MINENLNKHVYTNNITKHNTQHMHEAVIYMESSRTCLGLGRLPRMLAVLPLWISTEIFWRI